MMRNFTVACFLIVSIFGCGQVDTNGHYSQRSHNLEGDSFTDKNGWTWNLVGEIQSYEPGGLSQTHDEEPEGVETIGEMTVSEVAKRYRPLLEYDQRVYRLSDADTRQLAEEMKQAFEDGMPRVTGDPEPLDTTQTSTSTLRQAMVLGADTRGSYDASYYPHKEVAGVANTNEGNFCSAFKNVNHMTAITAAHCVYTPNEGWQNRQAWHFQADSNQGTPPMSKYCYSRVVTAGWAKTGRQAYDFAILRFNGHGEWCDWTAFNLGYLGAWGMTNERHVAVNGYPAQALSGNYPDYVWGDGAGDQKWFWPNMIVHDTDTTDGQSGAPIIRDPDGTSDTYVVGVNKGDAWSLGTGYTNWGRRYDGGVWKFMNRMSGTW